MGVSYRSKAEQIADKIVFVCELIANARREGFEKAREEAARIANREVGRIPLDRVAAAIRALEPDEELRAGQEALDAKLDARLGALERKVDEVLKPPPRPSEWTRLQEEKERADEAEAKLARLREALQAHDSQWVRGSEVEAHLLLIATLRRELGDE